eukprot:1149439-Pelagomonas_calceolata.AAC.9
MYNVLQKQAFACLQYYLKKYGAFPASQILIKGRSSSIIKFSAPNTSKLSMHINNLSNTWAWKRKDR